MNDNYFLLPHRQHHLLTLPGRWELAGWYFLIRALFGRDRLLLMPPPPTHSVLYNVHCLPWTLHCTWVCLKPAFAHSAASNGCGLSCGSLFYQVKLFAGRRVGPGSPASTPPERQDKNKSHKQSEKKRKKSGISMETRAFSAVGEGLAMYLVRCVI